MKDLWLRAFTALKIALLAILDRQIAKAPPEWLPGLNGLRDQINTATSEVTAELVTVIFKAIAEAFSKAKWGPATSDPADL